MKQKKLKEKWRHADHKKLFYKIGLILSLLIAFFLLIQVTRPETSDVKLFQVAEKTIRAPQTIEDTAKTKESQKKAADSVENVYSYNADTGKNRVALIQSIFDYVHEVNDEIKNKDKAAREKAKKDDKSAPKASSVNDKLKLLKSKLSDNVSEDITAGLSDNVLRILLQAPESDLATTQKVITDEISKRMGSSIRSDELTSEKIKARDNIELSNIPSEYKNISKNIVSYGIVANEQLDKEQTEAQRKEAVQSIAPVRILQGQVIVQEGQIIDRDTYRQLKLLHLLDKRMPVKQYIGYGLFLLTLASLLYVFAKKERTSLENRLRSMLIFSTVYLINLLLLMIVIYLESMNVSGISFLFPAAFAPMVIKILLNTRYAFLSIIFSAVTSLLLFISDSSTNINTLITVFYLLSSVASLIALRNQSRRGMILLSGLIVGGLNIVFVLLLLLTNNSPIWQGANLGTMGYGFLGGFGAFVLGIGLIPLFEITFGLLTTTRLVELANPNHPLLKRILMKAPGTYHHSMMVANLAEACADKIGANGLLVRVGCFYHDIGKTLRPPYFVENQLQGINPHDRLQPSQSRDIILAHTVDGAEMLREHHMPQPIIDIALEHHGTTLLKYFYYQAKENDPDTKEADYRYKGPKPQTKETAIINIADSVEAAVRASSEPTMDKIKTIIKSIIDERILDGQFNECDITIKELHTIQDTLITTLNGIYHQRIQYPDDK